MSTFPSVLSTYTDPNATDKLNSPSHSALHQAENSGLKQLERVIGVEGDSSVVGTIEYLIKSPDSDGGGHIQSVNKGGTGQTQYNKGDLIVGQSSSVLAKLAIGATGLSLVSDSGEATGLKWGRPTTVPTIKVYTSLATWAKPASITGVFVEAWGGGGSGGAIVNGIAPIATGGGGGTYFYGYFPASILSSIMQIGVGQGGASVAGSNNGNVGGDTFFGSILVAAGGGAGSQSSGGSPAAGTCNSFTISSLFAANGGDGTTKAGGSTVYGGAGGGGVSSPSGGAGGTAIYGGNGSAGAWLASCSPACILGGGGGGAANTSGSCMSGGGGRGELRLIEYY